MAVNRSLLPTALLLLLCCACFLATAEASVAKKRQADDGSLASLNTVVQQLAQKLEILESERNAMRGQMEEFDAILTQLTNKLAEKRCEPGMEAFNPHEQGNVIRQRGRLC